MRTSPSRGGASPVPGCLHLRLRRWCCRLCRVRLSELPGSRHRPGFVWLTAPVPSRLMKLIQSPRVTGSPKLQGSTDRPQPHWGCATRKRYAPITAASDTATDRDRNEPRNIPLPDRVALRFGAADVVAEFFEFVMKPAWQRPPLLHPGRENSMCFLQKDLSKWTGCLCSDGYQAKGRDPVGSGRNAGSVGRDRLLSGCTAGSRRRQASVLLSAAEFPYRWDQRRAHAAWP